MVLHIISGGGVTLIGGTSYKINKGKTLINGTGQNITFQKTVGTMPIGTKVKIKQKNDIDYTPCIIIHKGNPDTSLYDSSCNGVWIWCKRTMQPSSGGRDDETYTFDRMYGDFNTSDAKYVCDTFFPSMMSNPSSSILKTVKIPYYDSSANIVRTLGDGVSVKAFPLSLIEVGFSSGGDIPKDGAKLDYFNSAESRIAEDSTFYHRDSGYMLRTTSISDKYKSYYVDKFGGYALGTKRSVIFGFAPVFILPFDVKLDDNNYIID